MAGMPRLRLIEEIVLLPLAASALLPQFWLLVYLGATLAPAYFAAALMFSLAHYNALQISYHAYYLAQADAAQLALHRSSEKYDLFKGDVSAILSEFDLQDRSLPLEDLQIVVLEKRSERDPTFLNFRAFLQPRKIFKSLVLVSPKSKGQEFFLLHELGHISATSHHNALYASKPMARLAIAHAVFVVVSPTWLVLTLCAVSLGVEWFFRGTLRREYIADGFAWSRLSKSGSDIKLQARKVRAVLRANARTQKDELEATEIVQRERLCTVILDTPEGRADLWIKENGITALGAMFYTACTNLCFLVVAIVAALQFDGDLNRVALFLAVAFWSSLTWRGRLSARAWPEYYRLRRMLAAIPRRDVDLPTRIASFEMSSV